MPALKTTQLTRAGGDGRRDALARMPSFAQAKPTRQLAMREKSGTPGASSPSESNPRPSPDDSAKRESPEAGVDHNVRVRRRPSLTDPLSHCDSSQESLQEARRAFKRFAMDSHDAIWSQALPEVLAHLGHPLDEEEPLEQLADQLESSSRGPRGMITYEAFLRWFLLADDVQVREARATVKVGSVRRVAAAANAGAAPARPLLLKMSHIVSSSSHVLHRSSSLRSVGAPPAPTHLHHPQQHQHQHQHQYQNQHQHPSAGHRPRAAPTGRRAVTRRLQRQASRGVLS